MPNGFVTPYVGGVYDSPNLIRIADLMSHGAAARAAAAQRGGDISAQMWGNLGTGISHLIQAPQVARDQQIVRQGMLNKLAIEAEQLKAMPTRLALENEALGAARLRNTEAQKRIVEQDQLVAAHAASLEPDAYGNTRYNTEKLMTGLKGLPNGPATLDAAVKANETLESARNIAINRPFVILSDAARRTYEEAAEDGSDVMTRFGPKVHLLVENKRITPEIGTAALNAVSTAKDQKRALIGQMVLADRPKTEYREQPPGGSTLRLTPGLPAEVVSTSSPKPPNSEKATFRYQGKDVEGDYIPGASGQPGRYFYNGQDVTGQIEKVPAALMQVITAANQAVANLPSWALDDSRPVGLDTNRLDPTLRMTPNGLYQAAQVNIATGQFPPTGRGNDPAAQAVRAAITSKVGGIAAAAGMDVPALRAFYNANKASLTQQQRSYDTVAGFMETADKNADLLIKTLDKIPDVHSPLLNRPLRALDQKALGNVSMSEFKTYVQSVQNEYARIITGGPNLSQQLTDSARHEAQQLLDPNATVAQILGSIQALKNEGTNRLVSLSEQIRRIQSRMNGGGASQNGGTDDAYAAYLRRQGGR